MHLIESTLAGKRFAITQLNESLSGQAELDSASELDEVEIDLNVRHQPILGWGGSFTDSALLNIKSLSEELSIRLMESYFGKNGLQYNFGRVPIGSSDFSTRPYTYDSQPNDYELFHWNLAREDTELKIPMIKLAEELMAEAGDEELKLVASPWSAPEWMKTNNDLVQGFLIANEQVYQAYTNYLMKFYDAYRENEVEFWGATVQNEPYYSFFPNYTWTSMQYNSSDMIKFVGRFLGPALAERGMTKDKFKLLAGDDSLGLINQHVPELMADEEAQKFISGLAFHWYRSGVETPYSALTEVYDQIKDQIEFVIMTEACTGFRSSDRKKVDLGSWDRGESYAFDIIEDLNRYTSAWIDWNLALNTSGGPNFFGNNVDSPIIVDEKRDEFYKQPMYYALAHFSRFFRPGSIRVDSSVQTQQPEELSVAAVARENTGHAVVNLLNRSNRTRLIALKIRGSGPVKQRVLSVEPKSLNTVVLKL